MDDLRKWGGLFLLIIGLILGVSGAIVLRMEDSSKGGAVVMLALGIAAVTGGVLLNRQGERQIQEGIHESRLDAIRAQVARASARGRTAGPQAIPALKPERIEALRAMARDGRLPLNPVEAGLACLNCGVEAELRNVELSQHTGLLVVREHRTVRGLLCRHCIVGIANQFNSHNLKFGWCGPKSLIGTLVALPTNASHRREAEKMAPPDADAVPPELTPELVARLKPAAVGIADALVAGKEPRMVFQTVADKFSVSPGEALLFAAALAAQDGKA